MRKPSIVVWMIVALCGARVCAAQVAAPDTTVSADTTATTTAPSPAATDSLRTLTVTDSIGIPGTLKGQTDYDPREVKETLGRMGSDEVQGKTTWERKKNPQVAMLCSALLPGLGQTYNGRRLKVGLMVGFTSFYVGRMILNWQAYEETLVLRDAAVPGTAEYDNYNIYADFYKEEARTYLWWSGAVWLIGILDSWIDAHLYDVREYTPPPPSETVAPQRVEDNVRYITIGIGLSLK